MHIFVYNNETNKEEEIVCTPSHRIYIVNKGMIEAENILENNNVLFYNNTINIINKNYKEELTKEQTTYNFEVEENHNYYVSSDSVLVHNECQLARNMKKAGKMKVDGTDAHHIFPQKFIKKFNKLKIDIDDADYGYWLERSLHRKKARAYNKAWELAFESCFVRKKNAMKLAGKFMLDIYQIAI